MTFVISRTGKTFSKLIDFSFLVLWFFVHVIYVINAQGSPACFQIFVALSSERSLSYSKLNSPGQLVSARQAPEDVEESAPERAEPESAEPPAKRPRRSVRAGAQ